MHCTACGRANRDGAAFCAGCGSKLVVACASCGADLADDARFCDVCGAPAGEAAAPAPDAPAGDRKVVSILFADLSGSTSLQERLDAEATARLMGRIQQVLSSAVDAHGGRVVKSTGDGLMAVFGVPVLREDDAVRAVRAGVAMQEEFAALGLADVALRVGVNTGEVVVAPDSDDVVGDPVNVAARLEAAAPLGGVLVGPETQRLVRDVITLEPVEPLALRGKAEPVAAARVVGEVGVDRATVTPFLGREEDLATLVAALDDAVAASAARLVTVLGWPGLGKSRLATELAARVADRGTIVEARFVADGGTSFGPIADALRRVLDPAELDLGADGERVASTVAALVGGGGAGSTEQVFWAIRRAIEAMAATRPVVVVLDDLHWAEPAMLDLVEHLAEWLRGGPVLLLALARPELRDRRPALLDATGPSASVVVLGGLDADASRQLALEVLGADELPEGVLRRALEASEGNPLFLRELLRLLVDDGVLVPDGAGRWSLTVEVDAIQLPATIHAALAARIEQLQPDERAVLQAASVIGRHFPRGAVAALLPGAVAARLDEHLASLHRRALVDPEGTWWVDERLFRFHHVLIRDAAYRRVLKEVRADQHVRYADWLVARVGDATAEHDEVLAFHLEQALTYRGELGQEIDPDIVERAVGHLVAAGRRALDSDDLANAAALLGRAIELRPGDADVLRDRCEALVAGGDVHAATAAVAELVSVASDERSRAIADVFDAQLAGQRTPGALRDVAARTAAAAAVLAAHGDDIGVAQAESAQATALAGLGQVAACEAALDRSLAAARRAGDARRANAVLSIAPAAALWGPSPIARASGRCLDVVRVLRITSWAPHVEAHALRHQAVLEAMRDRGDAARRMLATARQTFTDLGHRLGLLETSMYDGLVELLDGQPGAAEAPLRVAVAGFESMGAARNRARATALLARALLELDRLDDALVLADPALGGDDTKASIGLLGVRAEVLARRGSPEEAEVLARQAVALGEPTDALVDHADARLVLARVLHAAGRVADGDAELAQARTLYEQKGATVGVRRCGDAAATAAPTGTGSPTARRVRPNRATAAESDRRAAFARKDLAALTSSYAPEYERVNHLSHSRAPLDEHLVGIANLVQDGGYVDLAHLATLGDHHMLSRTTSGWTEGPNAGVEIVRLIVTRVDGVGRTTLQDSFADDRLGDALACLVERWAEDELDDAARTRALRIADTVRAPEKIAASDWEGFAELFSPDGVLIDRRPTGAVHRGRDAIVAWHRFGHAATEGLRVAITDVLGFTENAALIRHEAVGTAAGGSFDNTTYVAGAYDDTGRLAHVEQFGLEQLDAAWACFERLASAGPRRKVPTTNATRVVERWLDAARRRDVAGARAPLDPTVPIRHHALGIDVGAEYVDTFLTMVEEGSVAGWEILAALGECAVLFRLRTVSATDVDGLGAGEVQNDPLSVSTVGPDGVIVSADIFEADDASEALACLVERWAQVELDGAERARAERIARAIALATDGINRQDWVSYAHVYAEDATLVDHRSTRTELRGRDEVISFVRALAESSRRLVTRIADIHAVTSRAMLWTWESAGETAEGAPFALPGWLAIGIDGGGGFDRLEFFRPEDVDDAWACFERFDAAPPARRVARTRAVEAIERWFAAAQALDPTVGALFAPGYAIEHHAFRAELSRAYLTHLDDALRTGATVEMDVIAALGERHVLTRLRIRTKEDGELRNDVLVVNGVDEQGRSLHGDLFDGEALPGAVACLVRRWAEVELTGATRDRALQSADSFTVADVINERDWDRFVSLFDEDITLLDHRTTGVEVRGRSAIRDWVTGLLPSTDAFETRLVDVLALTPEVTLWRWEATGRVDGGPLVIPSLIAVRVGPSGRFDRIEFFGPEQVEDALACFERLGAQPGAPARRVPSTVATRGLRQMRAAIESRDVDTLRTIIEPSLPLRHHGLGLDLGVEYADVFVGRVASGGSYALEPLAVLGEHHVLFRLDLRGTADVGGDFNAVALTVNRVADDGRFTAADTFYEERLADALACLFERWAETEAQASEAARARRTAATWARADALNAGDWPRLSEMLEPDVVAVDHRQTGVTVEGRDAYLDWLRAGRDAADRYEAKIHDVLGLTPEVSLTRWHAGGDVHGAPFSLPSYVVTAIGPSGATGRVEIFDVEDLAGAWACFDRLVAATARPRREVPRNLATEQCERYAAALAAGDIDSSQREYDESLRIVDHVLHLEFGYDEQLAAERGLGAQPMAPSYDAIATLGDRHALVRGVLRRGRTDNPVEWVRLSVRRVSPEGRALLFENFGLHDLAAAVRTLYERWAEDELSEAERERGARIGWVLGSIDDRSNARDWERFEELFQPDVVLTDHRGNGIEGHGPGEITGWLRELITPTDEFRTEIADLYALTPRAAFLHRRTVGVMAGGEFDWSSLNVVRFGPAGLIDRLDFLPPDAHEAGWAAFDRYDAAPRPREVAPNRATAAVDAWMGALAAGDVPAARAVRATDWVLHDHQLQLAFDRTAQEEREGLGPPAAVRWEALASLGERHSLHRFHIEKGSDRALAVYETLAVSRVNGDGLVATTDTFPVDELGLAVSWLFRRWAADERGVELGPSVWEARALGRAGDWEPLRAAYAPDVVYVDHRPGGQTLRGADDVVAWYRSVEDLADRTDYRMVDVLACSPDATLIEIELAGTREGGRFAQRVFNVSVLGAGRGLLRVEAFGPEQLDQAWACYDRSSGGSRPSAAPPAARRVRDNLATAPGPRWREVIGFEAGADGECTVIATLGKRHALYRAARHVGGGTQVRYHVGRVEADGAPTVIAAFAEDRLAAALACLVARWAEDELPPGARRDRATRSADAWRICDRMNAGDWDGLPLAVDAQVVDHRPAGAGTLRGAATITAWVRSLAEVTDGFRAEVTDVLAFTPSAALVAWRSSGSSPDAPVELLSLIVAELDEHGFTTMTFFSPEQRDDAWACFDALPLTPDSQPRRVTPNAASASMVVQIGESIDLDVLATLGERHALTRSTFVSSGSGDVGPLEVENLLVRRVDAQGLAVHEEDFAITHLDAALVCLVERWAEDELDEPARARASRMARFLRLNEYVDRRDWEGFGATLVQDVAMVDHRRSAVGPINGRAATVSWLRTFVESVVSIEARFTEVFAFSPVGLVAQEHSRGHMVGGAEWEMAPLIAVRFADDGLVDRFEVFERDTLDDALGLFDSWATTSSTRQRHAEPNLAVGRRVRPNRASEVRLRMAAALRLGDVDAVIATKAPGYVMHHHPTQTTMDVAEHRARITGLGPARVGDELLATLGERHSLHRTRMTWDDVSGAGPFHFDLLSVSAVDGDGRVVQEDNFEAEALSAGLACLVQRWAEESLEGPERRRALGFARVLRLAGDAADAPGWDHDCVAEDAVAVDRRSPANVEMRGRDDVLAFTRALSATAGGPQLTAILALEPSAALWQGDQHLTAVAVDADGRVAGLEVLPLEDLDAAWGCFDRLDRSIVARPRPRSNAATTVVEAWAETVHAGDLEAGAALYAPGYELVRHDHHLTEDRATWLQGEAMLSGRVRLTPRTLATLGDRHALTRLVCAVDGGDTQFDFLYVARVDDEGRVLREDLFPPEELGAALACLYERWAEDELEDPIARERALAIAGTWLGVAIKRRDWSAVRRMIAEDAVFVDHRRYSVGAIQGRDAITAWVRSYVETTDPTSLMLTDALAVGPDRMLIAADSHGSIGGGDVASATLSLNRWDAQGRIHLLEAFGLDQLGDAIARSAIDEPEPRSTVKPNLAWASVQRYARLARASDVDGVRDLYAPSYELQRHDQHVELDRERQTANESRYIEAGTLADVDHLLTLGERVDLHRLTLERDEDGAGQVVPYGLLVVTVVGDDGRFVSDDVFPPDQLDAAIVRAMERWAAAELDGLARDRAIASTAMVWNSRAINTRDWDLYRSGFEPDAILVDHRPTSAGEVRGVDAIVEWMQVIAEGELQTAFDRILAMTPDAWLVRWHAAGARNGGTFELPSIIAVRLGERGLTTEVHVFGDDRIDDAWACFDSFAVTRPQNNATSRLLRAWADAVVRRDADAAMGMTAPEIVSDDRRPLVGNGVMVGQAASRAHLDAICEVGVDSISVEVLAVRGDRMALSRVTYAVGEASTRVLHVNEVDESCEHFTRGVMFDDDDLDAAEAELHRLAAQLLYDEGASAHNDRDAERFRAWFDHTTHIENHRPAAFGVTDADGFLALTVSLWDLHRASVRGTVERATRQAALVHSLTEGEDNEGGVMQIDSIVVMQIDDDGRIARFDTWDITQRAEAEAFYDALLVGSESHAPRSRTR